MISNYHFTANYFRNKHRFNFSSNYNGQGNGLPEFKNESEQKQNLIDLILALEKNNIQNNYYYKKLARHSAVSLQNNIDYNYLIAKGYEVLMEHIKAEYKYKSLAVKEKRDYQQKIYVGDIPNCKSDYNYFIMKSLEYKNKAKSIIQEVENTIQDKSIFTTTWNKTQHDKYFNSYFNYSKHYRN
jgi:hypothetical protein